MDAQQLLNELIADAGIDDTTKNQLLALANNDKVKAKAANFRGKSEFDALESERSKLEQSYNKAKTFEDWYAQNGQKVQDLNAKYLVYRERFGDIAADGTVTGGTGGGAPAVGLTMEQMNAEMDKRIGSLTQSFSNTFVKGVKITERHVRANRKTEVDWDAIQKIAAEKTNGDIEAAYEQWDQPVRATESAEKTEAEIKRRVNEEVARMRTQQTFPAGADGSQSGALSPLTRSRGGDGAAPAYDRNAVLQAAMGVQ